jgi:dihydrofolate reductase
MIRTTKHGYQVEHSVTAGIELARARGEAVVGGGAEIYAQCLDLADRIYLTLVEPTVRPIPSF